MFELVQEIDQRLFLFLNNELANPIMDVIMGIANQMGTIRIVYPIAVIGLFFCDKANWIKNSLILASILFLEIFFGHLLKDIIGRSRPDRALEELIMQNKVTIHKVFFDQVFPFFTDVAPGVEWQSKLALGAKFRGYSFPSGHTFIAFGLATFFAVHVRRLSYFLYSLAVLSGLARVYVGAHYPFDVLAGMVVGVSIAKFLLSLLSYESNRLNGKKHDMEMIKNGK